MWRWLVLTMFAAPAFAGDGIDVAAQRERITHERAQAEANYHKEATRCAGQFSVTACVDRARSERRAAVERLDHERAVLDDMERKRRAAERMRRIQDKMRAAETRSPPQVHAIPRSAKAGRAAASAAAPDAAPPASSAPARAAEAAYKQRKREAAAHREAVERRNAERAARRAPAAPLPAPSAASR
jgi:colicin import membrane protein